MANIKSYEIIEYRRKIKDILLDSDLLFEEMDVRSKSDMWLNNVFPYERIPSTVSKSDKYICYEIKSTKDRANPTYKNITIYFFISTDVNNLDDLDLWHDRIVCILDELFTEKSMLGVTNIELIDNVPYSPIKEYAGRMVVFSFKDFMDGKKNGK